MSNRKDEPPDMPPAPGPRPGFVVPAAPDRVQCPNCCRLARVTSQRADLVFYACELCGSVGATPAGVTAEPG